MIILHIGLLSIILVITPLLLVRRFSTGVELTSRLTALGITAILLTLCAALGLHGAHIPITAITLTTIHLAFFVLALGSHALPSACFNIFSQPARTQPTSRQNMTLLCAALLLFILLFPYTHFTGIDTYKWQDLATSVRVEKSLPWIVHPLSLFGFTPRAYPPAHPILLATVQIVGDLGVEGGFTVVSIFIALLGLASSTTLARRLLSPKAATAAGILYCFSPVFIRYSHWSTGRGLFLAIFPAFIAVLLPTENVSSIDNCSNQPRLVRHLCRFIAILMLALLLLLTHKVALVAVPLTLLAVLATQALPRRLPNIARIVMMLPFLAAAAAIVSPAVFRGPIGQVFGLLRTGVMRFAWMLPFALAGLWLPAADDATVENATSRRWTMFLLGALPAITFAFERQMYGALYALPFICIFAIAGFNRINALISPHLRYFSIIGAVCLTIFGASATIIVRSKLAATPELYAAAMFLEQYDPQGPFAITAPGIARTRIQAYVSGCARFEIRTDAHSSVQWPSPPPRRATLRATADAYVSWLRSFFSLSDTETSWYGNPHRYYHFIINRQGSAPSGATLIYDRGNIVIYESKP